MKSVFVKRHPRRHPMTPEQRVHAAERTLQKLDADGDLGSICHVLVSDEDSQVLPPPGGFRKGHCSIVNIEPLDLRDEVECATTLFHEAVHVRQIKEHGEKGIGQEQEIAAHEETIRFLQDWSDRETDRKVWCTENGRQEQVKDRISEVVAEERESIRVLRKEGQ